MGHYQDFAFTPSEVKAFHVFCFGLFFIEVELTYHVKLVSGVQHSDLTFNALKISPW